MIRSRAILVMAWVLGAIGLALIWTAPARNDALCGANLSKVHQAGDERRISCERQSSR